MDIHSALNNLFSYAPAVGMQGVVQFIFSTGENIWIDIGGDTRVVAGNHDAADVEIVVSTQDFLAIVAGNADIEQLFASGQIKINGNLGLATLLPQLIDHAIHPNTDEVVAGIDMNARYPAPPRFSETLSASQPDLHSIDRVASAELSVEEFKARYLATGIPVVIHDALNSWPLFRMSREESPCHFARLNGITRHGDYVSNTFSTTRDFRTTSMSEFIASLDDEIDNNGVPAYMGNNIVPTQLLEKICFPPYFDVELYNAPRIWIGPKGTLTPLHRDDSDNLFAQVWGEKKFILAAPHHRQALNTWSTSPTGGLDGCDFNPATPDYEKFPQAKHVTFHHLLLEAGDLLFLPEGWFHQVEAVSTSLSVNFWINSGRGW